MNLQQWLAKIRLVAERTGLHERASHRQMFIDLAGLAIAAQDRGALPFAQDGLLTGYRCLVGDYLRQRARGVLLPRGLRLGVPDFTPILQLAKAFDLGEVAKLDIVALPKGRRQLIDHFLGLIGIDAGTGEPAALKTLFGFRIADYAAFLVGLRSTDAIAYTMLLAHEFKLASERLQDPGSLLWVERGATLPVHNTGASFERGASR